MTGSTISQAACESNVGVLNRNNATTSGRFSKGDNISYSPQANVGAQGSKLRLDLSHTHNMQHNHTVDISHTHGTDSNGGTESRPVDYTYKIWKRTA